MMNSKEREQVRSLATAFFNPFQLKYEERTQEDVLNEVMTLLTIPGALELWQESLKDVSKKYYEQVYSDFKDQFQARFERDPEEFARNSEEYKNEIQAKAQVSVEFYIKNPKIDKNTDLGTWRAIAENMTNELFAQAVHSELKTARKSEILFNNKLEEAKHAINRENVVLMAEVRRAKREFVKAGGGAEHERQPERKKEGLMSKISSYFMDSPGL